MSVLDHTTTGQIMVVGHIIAGDAECFCGEPAVLDVRTEPDGEPGTTCYRHAREWLDMADGLIACLYGPRKDETSE